MYDYTSRLADLNIRFHQKDLLEKPAFANESNLNLRHLKMLLHLGRQLFLGMFGCI